MNHGRLLWATLLDIRKAHQVMISFYAMADSNGLKCFTVFLYKSGKGGGVEG